MAVLSGCLSDLEVGENVQIACGADGRCPDGWICKASLSRCVKLGANSPPKLVLGAVARSNAVITFPVTVFDDDEDTVSLTAELLSGEAAAPRRIELLPSSLPATSSGTPWELTWDPSGILSAAYMSGLRLQLTPADSHDEGTAVLSPPFDHGNDAPVVSAVSVDLPPGGSVRGNAVVRFTVADSAADAVTLSSFEFSLAGDFSDAVNVPLTTGASGNFPSGALSGLASSVLGVEHSLTWSSHLAAPIDAAAVRIRLGATDVFGSTSARVASGTFALDNASSPPSILLVATPTGTQTGDITVEYTLADADSDPCLVAVEYTTDGIAFTPASTASPTTGLASGPHTFVWQSSQLGFMDVFSAVQLRLSVSDADNIGNSVLTPSFSVDNTSVVGNALPVVVLEELTERPLTEVVFDYALIDGNLDLCSVTPRFSLDGVSWLAATEALVGSDGVDDLVSGQGAGVAHTFVWDALADARAGVGGLSTAMIDTDGDGTTESEVVASAAGVRFSLRANDGSDGLVDVTPPFALGNDSPVVSTSVPDVEQTGLVVFDYTLTDPLSDPCSLRVEYSIDGSTFEDATLRLTSSTTNQGVVVGRPSLPEGVTDILTWDSVSDLPAAYRGQVELRVTPFDGISYGEPASSGAFLVHNNTPPVVTSPADLSAGVHGNDITVEFELTDESSDPVQILVQYSLDGAEWRNATVISSTAGLSSSPSGVQHAIVWRSASDLPRQEHTGVRLRITPSDFDDGTPLVWPNPFRVDNLAPRILSYAHRDLDGDGNIDRVDVQFDEKIAKASLALVSAFHTEAGVSPESLATASGGDDATWRLTFSRLEGTAPVPITYVAAAGRLADLAGNLVPSTGPAEAATYDLAAPVLMSVVAREQLPQVEGLDAGDQVRFVFSEPIAEVSLTDADLSSVFAVSPAHTWVGDDGVGAIGWDSSRRNLTISLAGNSILPTVQVGDTVSVTSDRLYDAAGGTVDNQRVITGSLSPVWQRYSGFPPPLPVFSARIAAAYDPDGERMLVFGGFGEPRSIWSLDLQRGGESWQSLDVTGAHPPAEFTSPGIVFDQAHSRLLVLSGDPSRDQLWSLNLTPGAFAWSQILPASAGPGGRRGQAVVYDPIAARVLVFGGVASGIDSDAANDLWALDITPGEESWRELAPQGEPPPARSFCATAYDSVNHRLVLFGGVGADSMALGDLFALDMSGDGTWSPLLATGTAPLPHSHSTAVFDSANERILLFGGKATFNPDNDLWALDLRPWQEAWSPVDAGGTVPEARTNAAAIYDAARERLVLFAGQAAIDALNDTHLLDCSAGNEAWSELVVDPRPAPGRYQHAAVYDPDRQRMVVFGGSVTGIDQNSTWSFSLAPGNEGFAKLSPSGEVPTFRWDHTAVYDSLRKRMIVYGGMPDTARTETYILTLTPAESWSKLDAPGAPARDGHVAVYDSDRDRMLVFGGFFVTSDVHALSLAPGSESWSILAPAGVAPNPSAGSVAVYDQLNHRMVLFGGSAGGGDVSFLSFTTSNGTWSTASLSNGPPSGLADSIAAYDAASQRMLVFGGLAAGHYNSLWSLDLTDGAEAWTLISPAGAKPLPRYLHAGVFDANNQRLVICGGRTSDGYIDTFADLDVWWY